MIINLTQWHFYGYSTKLISRLIFFSYSSSFSHECWKKYNNKRNKINFLWWQFLIYFFLRFYSVDLTTQCFFAVVHNFYEWTTLALMEMTVSRLTNYWCFRLHLAEFCNFFEDSSRDKWTICYEVLDWLRYSILEKFFREN